MHDRIRILSSETPSAQPARSPLCLLLDDLLGSRSCEAGNVDFFPGMVVESVCAARLCSSVEVTLREADDSPDEEWHCCGCQRLHRNGTRCACCRDTTLGGLPCMLRVRLQTYECQSCGRAFRRKPPLMHPRHMVTMRLWHSLQRKMRLTGACVSSVAEETGVNWEIIKEADKEYLEERFRYIDTSEVRRVAMDEFSIRRGQSYATMVIDADTRMPLYITEGKTSEDLRPFFDLLKMRGHDVNIVGATMDGNAGFAGMAARSLPKAQIVLDEFHVLQNYNRQVVDAERMALRAALGKKAAEACGDKRKAILRESARLSKLKWVLYRGWEGSEGSCGAGLRELLKSNETLYTVSIMGDALRDLWSPARSQDEARKAAEDWVAKALASGVASLAVFARRVRKDIDKIVGACTSGLNTSILEGMNNRCKQIKRVAYGFRDMRYYFLKIFDAFSRSRVSTLKPLNPTL